MISISIDVKSYVDDVLKAELAQRIQGLEAVGIQAEGFAKNELTTTDPKRVDSGLLRNSITHRIVDNKSLLVGTNVFYAVYVHEGTGIYGNNPKNTGGKTWWVYVKGGTSQKISAHGKRYTKAQAARIMLYLRDKGLDAWMTQGMRPNRFLTNALVKNKRIYKAIIGKYYRGG